MYNPIQVVTTAAAQNPINVPSSLIKESNNLGSSDMCHSFISALVFVH
jgi:hypothetical protein